MSDTTLLQRRIFGFMCAALGPACVLFGLLGDNLPYWYCSISATYYANSKMCMIGLLFATGVFFFSYRGYDWIDRIFSIVQAVCAWGIVMFPCITYGVEGRVGLFSVPVETSNIIHCVFAGGLFAAFALNVGFVFTLGDKTNPMKRKRNTVYIVCASVMSTFLIFEVISSSHRFYPVWFPMTIINETVMLECYAVAWLVKSGMFLKDK